MGIFKKKAQVGTIDSRVSSLAEVQRIIDRGGVTYSGVVVDPDKAMRSSSVWACIELIAGVGSSLPLDEFRKDTNGQKAVPLSSIFADPDPDPSVSPVGFRAQVLRSAAVRGNAYADVIGGGPGVTPTGLVSIHPDRVTWRWEKYPTGGAGWEVYVDNVKRSRWPLGDLWHFALFQEPGCPVGLSPVEYHKQSIGASLAAQKFGQQFFDGGGNPSMIIKPPEMLSEEQAKDIKARVLEVTRGNREPLVMPQQIELERVSVNPDDSQFLETQRYGVEEIARVFLGGFPELIGGASSGSSVTYANREQRMADFIALSLSPRYLVPLEAALSSLVPDGRYVRHNVNALLRSDLTARYASYKTAAEVSQIMGAPLLSVDEMRALEDLEPVANGAGSVGGSQSLSPAEALQKIYLAVGVVITADEARAIVNDMTGTKLTPSMPASARSEALAELREWAPPQVHVHNHAADSTPPPTSPPVVNITNVMPSEERSDVVIPAPVVNINVDPTPVTNVVNVPDQPAPVVNFAAGDVTVNVPDQPAPVVNVAPADVTVNVDDTPMRKTVRYDGRGRVAEIIEEQV